MEFLLIISFLFLISLGFIIAAGVKMSEFSSIQEIDAIQDFAGSLERELELAAIVKDGYERSIELPTKISGLYEYNITMVNGTLFVIVEGKEYFEFIPEVQGSLQIGKNIIKKLNNTVVIEND